MAGPQVHAPEEQVRLRIVRRQEQHAIQLGDRLSIALLRDQAAGPIEVELREFLLVVLAVGERLLNLPGVRQFDVALHALQASRHRIGCRTFVPVGVGRRQPPCEFLLTQRLAAVARGVQAPRQARNARRRRSGRGAAPRAASRLRPACRGPASTRIRD